MQSTALCSTGGSLLVSVCVCALEKHLDPFLMSTDETKQTHTYFVANAAQVWELIGAVFGNVASGIAAFEREPMLRRVS